MRRAAERASPPGRTPLWLTSFIGRRRELAALTDAVRRHRLITLVGPGGIGKSRLAAALTQRGAVRSWWTDSTDLPTAVPDIARTGSHLVILDVGTRARTDTVVDVVERLVTDTTATVVVTSRRPLSVAGEQRWPVNGLTAPDAAALFLTRLREVEPGATVDRDALAELCTALDGVPLALEIAAVHARTAGVREIIADLRRLVRVAGTSRTPRDGPPSIAATVRDSRTALSPEADLTLGHLHLLTGPFPVHLAEAMASPPLSATSVRAALIELVDAGLVRSTIGPNGPMLHVTRTAAIVVGQDWSGPAVDRLGTRRRRAIASVLHVAASHLHGPDGVPWLRLVHDRATDTDAALENAAALRGTGALADLIEPLAEVWFWTGDHARATRWTRQAVACRVPDHLTEAVRGRAARAALLAGRPAEAVALLPAPEPPSAATTVHRACAHALTTGTGTGTLLSALQHARATGDRRSLLESLTLTGETLALLGDVTIAERTWAEAYAMIGNPDDATARGRVLAGWAAATLALGRVDDARTHALAATAAANRTGDTHAQVHAQLVLSRVAAAAGDWAGAFRQLRRTWARPGTAAPGLAAAPLAWTLLELAHGAGRTVDLGQMDLDRPDTDCTVRGPFLTAALTVAHARHRLSMGRFTEARTLAEQAGASLAPTDAPAWSARARWLLGEIGLASGDLPTARRHYQAAVRMTPATTHSGLVADCADGLALVAWAAGDRPRARKLLTAVDQWRHRAHWSRSPPTQDRLDAVGTGSRTPADKTPGPAADHRRPARGSTSGLRTLVLRPEPTDAPAPDDDVARQLSVLSRTEREVGRLVAAGRSNIEVGRELFMSLSTVKTHLSHIYRKLDVTSRAQLAYLFALHQDDRRGG